MAVKAVIDRIEDGKFAVLLIGAKQEERVVPVDQLPAGSGEGCWVIINADGTIAPDAGATDAARTRIQDKLAKLRNRGRRN